MATYPSLLLTIPLLFAACGDIEDDASERDPFGSGRADSITSDSPDRLIDVPYYFSMPKTSVSVPLNRPLYPQPTLWNPAPSGDELGLRIIAVKQGDGLNSRRSVRRTMAANLSAAGVLQTGDIILSFRPELAGTMAYPHIQMGSTHAGLVVVDEDGTAFNIDSPLDHEYMGKFDAPHYAGELDEDGNVTGGTHALHVLRPRVMDETRRAQMRDWVRDLTDNLGEINGVRRQIKFQKDYLSPAYLSHGKTPKQLVTTLGLIILEEDTETQLPMYCSEFAWHMLALSNCSSEEILNAPEEGADCVDPPFELMPLLAQSEDQTGIAEGPLKAIAALPEEMRAQLVEPIFADGNAQGLSSGHRAVAEEVRPLMGPLNDYYQARIAGATAEDMAPVAAAISENFAPNYSPTAYFIAAMGDEATRAMDYVVTIAFVNAQDYDKARGLAQLPVP